MRPIPDAILNEKLDSLSSFERIEIMGFKVREIYYLGLQPPNINPEDLVDNYGFYKAVPGDHIIYRYKVIRKISFGAFGQVFEVYDFKHECLLALKMFRTNKLAECLHESNMLIHAQRSANPNYIVQIYKKFTFRGHPCIVMELLGESLWHRVKQTDNKLNLSAIKKITLSIVKGLHELNKLNIVHCDIKCDNILFVRPGSHEVKIADLGCSMYELQNFIAPVQVIKYRAPEVFLHLPFKRAIDMWSLGCIVAEMFTGQPLFPGNNSGVVLGMMADAVGLPPLTMLTYSKVSSIYFHYNRRPKWSKNANTTTPLEKGDLHEQLYHSKSVSFVNFVYECLEWDPNKRLTPEMALAHPWLREESTEDNHESNHNKSANCTSKKWHSL